MVSKASFRGGTGATSRTAPPYPQRQQQFLYFNTLCWPRSGCLRDSDCTICFYTIGLFTQPLVSSSRSCLLLSACETPSRVPMQSVVEVRAGEKSKPRNNGFLPSRRLERACSSLNYGAADDIGAPAWTHCIWPQIIMKNIWVVTFSSGAYIPWDKYYQGPSYVLGTAAFSPHPLV